MSESDKSNADDRKRAEEMKRKAAFHNKQADLYAEASHEQRTDELSSAVSALSEAHRQMAAAIRNEVEP